MADTVNASIVEYFRTLPQNALSDALNNPTSGIVAHLTDAD